MNHTLQQHGISSYHPGKVYGADLCTGSEGCTTLNCPLNAAALKNHDRGGASCTVHKQEDNRIYAGDCTNNKVFYKEYREFVVLRNLAPAL